MATETRLDHPAPARPPRRLVDDRRRPRHRRVRGPAHGAHDDGRGDRAGAGQGVRPARPRRRRLPGRDQVVVPARGHAAALPRRERRRGRAVDVQGPDAARARPAPAGRGHRHRRVRDRVPPGVRLHPGRVRARLRAAHGRDRRGPASGLPRPEHARLRLRPRDRRAPRRRRLHLRRGDGACSRASRASGACPASARRSPRSRACTPSRPSSTTSRRSRRCRTSSRWAARSTPSSA